MTYRQLTSDELKLVDSILQQYSKYVVVLLSVCIAILAATALGNNQIELFSIRMGLFWGAMLGFISICTLLLLAASSAHSIYKVVSHDRWLESDKQTGDSGTEHAKVGFLLAHKPHFFSPYSLLADAPFGSYAMFLAANALPVLTVLVIQYQTFLPFIFGLESWDMSIPWRGIMLNYLFTFIFFSCAFVFFVASAAATVLWLPGAPSMGVAESNGSAARHIVVLTFLFLSFFVVLLLPAVIKLIEKIFG